MTHSPSDADKPGCGGHSTTPDPSEGLRLLKAFMNIADPKVRIAVIEFIETLAKPGLPSID